jgi:hypothetical protein
MRQHRNKIGGFWVASVDREASDEALTGTIPLHNVRAFALISDGATRLVDRFDLDSWDGLVSTLCDEGPESLLASVRIAETSDPTGQRWPRGKARAANSGQGFLAQPGRI